MAARPLLAIDGDNLAHRAWHALPKSITGVDGQPDHAVVGFMNMLLRAWEAEQPRTVFVAFDTVGTPTYRNELLPQYQSGRDFAKELTLEGGYTLETLPGFVRAVAPGAVTDGPFS